MHESIRRRRASVHFSKFNVLPGSYVHPQEPSDSRFDRVVKRFGLPPSLDTPKARNKPKRDQNGEFTPPISPPMHCQTTFDSPAFPLEAPGTVKPPRPPRAASRSRSASAARVLMEQMLPTETRSLPTTPALQPALVIEETSEAWKMDRKLSSLINGLGLDEDTASSDHFEDAKESLEELPTRPRSMSLPGTTAEIRQFLREDESAPVADNESSATADVLESYTESPDLAQVEILPPESETPEDYPSRKARRASINAVRSWLPTLHPPDVNEEGPSSSASSRRQSSLFDNSLRTIDSHTSWGSKQEVEEQLIPEMRSRKPAMRRRSSTLFSAMPDGSSHPLPPLHDQQAIRAKRRRSHSESAGHLPRTSTVQQLKPAIKSAACSPALGSMPFPAPTWRSTLQAGEHDLLLSVYGIDELRRQETIAELCTTEAAFVNGLQGVVRVFFLPLRRGKGAWIKGVPPPIARLFDWLEDIVWLHTEISQALEMRRAASHPIVNRIADVFLGFVQRLEVHQPFLVRFDAVSALIEQHLQDERSDFGEFVRMQQLLPECGKMTLLSFLLKPIQRLMKYPLFFKQLCELTPPSHPDHLATLSLLHSTDAMIRVMQEVKAREEEYLALKDLAARLHNLPHGFKLARRERRLIAHGQLRRVQRAKSPDLARKASNLGARLMPLMSPRSSIFSDNSDLSAASSVLPTSPRMRFLAKAEMLHVFVFTDIIIFATFHPDQRSRRAKEGEGHYELVEAFGLGKVLGVIDLSQRDDDHLIELTILPIEGGDESIAAMSQACSTPVTIYLSLPRAHSSVSQTTRIADRQRWVTAFEQSLKTTLRALAAMPASASRWSVESNMAAGLPMPKSPSEQALEREWTRQGEREERGYWAGRLKNVRREFAIDQPAVLPGAPPLPPLPKRI